MGYREDIERIQEILTVSPEWNETTGKNFIDFNGVHSEIFNIIYQGMLAIVEKYDFFYFLKHILIESASPEERLFLKPIFKDTTTLEEKTKLFNAFAESRLHTYEKNYSIKETEKSTLKTVQEYLTGKSSPNKPEYIMYAGMVLGLDKDQIIPLSELSIGKRAFYMRDPAGMAYKYCIENGLKYDAVVKFQEALYRLFISTYLTRELNNIDIEIQERLNRVNKLTDTGDYDATGGERIKNPFIEHVNNNCLLRSFIKDNYNRLSESKNITTEEFIKENALFFDYIKDFFDNSPDHFMSTKYNRTVNAVIDNNSLGDYYNFIGNQYFEQIFNSELKAIYEKIYKKRDNEHIYQEMDRLLMQNLNAESNIVVISSIYAYLSDKKKTDFIREILKALMLADKKDLEDAVHVIADINPVWRGEYFLTADKAVFESINWFFEKGIFENGAISNYQEKYNMYINFFKRLDKIDKSLLQILIKGKIETLNPTNGVQLSEEITSLESYMKRYSDQIEAIRDKSTLNYGFAKLQATLNSDVNTSRSLPNEIHKIYKNLNLLNEADINSIQTTIKKYFYKEKIRNLNDIIVTAEPQKNNAVSDIIHSVFSFADNHSAVLSQKERTRLVSFWTELSAKFPETRETDIFIPDILHKITKAVPRTTQAEELLTNVNAVFNNWNPCEVFDQEKKELLNSITEKLSSYINKINDTESKRLFDNLHNTLAKLTNGNHDYNINNKIIKQLHKLYDALCSRKGTDIESLLVMIDKYLKAYKFYIDLNTTNRISDIVKELDNYLNLSSTDFDARLYGIELVLSAKNYIPDKLRQLYSEVTINDDARNNINSLIESYFDKFNSRDHNGENQILLDILTLFPADSRQTASFKSLANAINCHDDFVLTLIYKTDSILYAIDNSITKTIYKSIDDYLMILGESQNNTKSTHIASLANNLSYGIAKTEIVFSPTEELNITLGNLYLLQENTPETNLLEDLFNRINQKCSLNGTAEYMVNRFPESSHRNTLQKLVVDIPLTQDEGEIVNEIIDCLSLFGNNVNQLDELYDSFIGLKNALDGCKTEFILTMIDAIKRNCPLQNLEIFFNNCGILDNLLMKYYSSGCRIELFSSSDKNTEALRPNSTLRARSSTSVLSFLDEREAEIGNNNHPLSNFILSNATRHTNYDKRVAKSTKLINDDYLNHIRAYGYPISTVQVALIIFLASRYEEYFFDEDIIGKINDFRENVNDALHKVKFKTMMDNDATVLTDIDKNASYYLLCVLMCFRDPIYAYYEFLSTLCPADNPNSEAIEKAMTKLDNYEYQYFDDSYY